LIVVDSSAWIEYLRASGSPTHHRLREALAEGEQLATTGVVVLELLAGARDESHAAQISRLVANCRLLQLQAPADYEAAAALYRRCRRAGVTPRSLIDCLIAAVTIRSGSALLHQDADFDAIARHAPLTCEL
jgi:predicted nucleic acid-binding protein